jgi:hypothetical protein
VNRNGTSLLVLAALALLTYILVFERRTPSPGERAAQARQLVPDFDPGRVNRLEIIRSNTVIRAERQLDRWQLTEPAYPAQSGLIDDWLKTLAQQTRRATLSSAEVRAQPGGPSALGLEDPLARITLQQGGQRIQLHLGRRTQFGERGYAQFVGDGQVIATESALWDRLPRTSSDWRDPVFVNLAGLRFDRVSLRSGSRNLEVQRDGHPPLWRITQPRLARADNGRIDQLWAQLQTVHVAEFVNDSPGADLEPYGLQPPELSVTFTRGTNPVLTVDFGRSPTNAPTLVYARRSLSAGIVLLPKALRETLAMPYTQLLDLQFYDVPIAELSRLEARAAEDFALTKQTNGAWKVTEPRELPADPAYVQLFLDRLRQLRVARIEKEVVTEFDLPQYGLASPSAQYRFFAASGGTNGTHQLLVRLDLGTNRADEVFARRSDENPVYVLKRSDLGFLPLAAFEFRDRRIWNFTTNEVAAVTIETSDGTHKLVRSPAGEWTFAVGSQGIFNPFALEEAVFRLGQLWARAWVAQGGQGLDRYGIPQVNHKLTVEFAGANAPKPVTVAFGATSRTGGPFAVTTLEGDPMVFEFPIEIFHVYEEVVNRMSLKPAATP